MESSGELWERFVITASLDQRDTLASLERYSRPADQTHWEAKKWRKEKEDATPISPSPVI